MTMQNAQELFEKVRQWAEDKGITGPVGKGTITGQLAKVNEEIAELNKAILEGDDAETIDAIGDSIVTLIILADLHGYRAEECLAEAYDIISRRTGRMIDGIFVKDK